MDDGGQLESALKKNPPSANIEQPYSGEVEHNEEDVYSISSGSSPTLCLHTLQCAVSVKVASGSLPAKDDTYVSISDSFLVSSRK